MPEHRDLDSVLLAAYLADPGDPEVREEIARWAAEDPARRAWVQMQASESLFDVPPVLDQQRVQAHVLARLERSSQQPARQMRFRSMIPRIAFAIAGIAAAIGFWSLRTSESRLPISREYETARGQYATLQLPDGSRVMLAPESRLQYRESNDNGRSVTLAGQGVFSVVHDPRRAFVVQTGNVNTRVVGTEFDIQHYPHDQQVRVTVMAGKVATTGPGQSAIVTAGSTVYAGGAGITTVPTDSASAVWIGGRLVFTNTPVRTVLESIGRWYGYQFRLADSTLASRHLTVGFSIDKRDEMLRLLSTVLDVQAVVAGDTITLHPRRTTSSPPTRRDQFRLDSPSFSEVGK